MSVAALTRRLTRRADPRTPRGNDSKKGQPQSPRQQIPRADGRPPEEPLTPMLLDIVPELDDIVARATTLALDGHGSDAILKEMGHGEYDGASPRRERVANESDTDPGDLCMDSVLQDLGFGVDGDGDDGWAIQRILQQLGLEAGDGDAASGGDATDAAAGAATTADATAVADAARPAPVARAAAAAACATPAAPAVSSAPAEAAAGSARPPNSGSRVSAGPAAVAARAAIAARRASEGGAASSRGFGSASRRRLSSALAARQPPAADPGPHVCVTIGSLEPQESAQPAAAVAQPQDSAGPSRTIWMDSGSDLSA